MSKKLITAALLLITASTFAQQPSTADATPQQIIERLNLAGHLVNYGYETQTALPLIQAVKIYQELNLRPAIDGLKPTVEGETTEETPTAHARTEEQLLADATRFAKGNPHLLALVAECQTVSRKPTAALFYHNDYIAPKGTHRWDVPLEGGHHSIVQLSGDGSSDLDLYLYDPEGREIDKETSAGDQCGLTIFEDLSSVTVKIVNRGHVTNNYRLTVY